jgi:invasion protein IalB
LIHAMLNVSRHARRAARALAVTTALLALPTAHAADTTTQPAPVPGAPAATTQPAPAAAQPAAPAGQAQPAPKPRLAGRFKDWALVCIAGATPGAPEECYLNDIPEIQTDTKLPAVVIGYASTDKGQRVLAIRFYLPPNTDKAAGFQVSIGKNVVVTRGEIPLCKADACETVILPITAELGAAMKKGATMVLGYKATGGAATTAPISLSGITAALTALAQGAPPATITPPSTAAAAAPQGDSGQPKLRVAQEFNEWAIICSDQDSNPATPEKCILNHSVDRGRTMALNILYAQPAPDKPKELVLEFVFPATAQQEGGFKATIDGKDLLNGPILKCEKPACITLMPLTTDLAAALKKGTTLTVAFKLKDKGAITAKASLKGFTAALDTYKKMNGIPVVAQAAAPAPKVTAFQDWSMVCGKTAAGAAQKCILSQSVPPKQESDVLLVARFGFADPGNGQPRQLVLQLLFPPAIDKASGFQMSIDNKPGAQTAVKECDARLCQATMALQPGTLDALKQGAAMTVVYKIKDKGPVTAPVSLKGLAAAIDALAKS